MAKKNQEGIKPLKSKEAKAAVELPNDMANLMIEVNQLKKDIDKKFALIYRHLGIVNGDTKA